MSLPKCGDQAWMQNLTEVWPNATLVGESEVINIQISEISSDHSYYLPCCCRWFDALTRWLQICCNCYTQVPRAQTATGQRSFAVNGPTVWNSLPPALRSLDLSQNTFKRTLKTHLFSSIQRHWVVLNETLLLLINLLTYLLTYCTPEVRCSKAGLLGSSCHWQIVMMILLLEHAVLCWTSQMWCQLRSLMLTANITDFNDKNIIFHLVTDTNTTRCFSLELPAVK